MKKLLILLIALIALGSVFAVALNEGFEGTTFPPAEWSVYNGGDTNTWFRSTSAAHTGSNGAQISYSSTAHNDYLITPKLSVTASNYTFSFWAKNYSSSYVEHFKVLLSTTDNVYTSFTQVLAADVAPPTTWTQYTYNLSTPTNFVGQNVYIAVVAISTDQFYLYLDDFTGPDIYVSNDPEPSNHVTAFAAGTSTFTSIPLNWTGAVGAQLPAGYLIQAIKTGVGSYAPVADGTPVANDAVWTDGNFAINVAHAVGANTYTLTGLSPNTAYEIKIWPYTNSLTNIDFKTDGTIPTVSGTTLNPLVTTFPYEVDFSTWQPLNWAQYSYLYGGTPATGGSWGQDDWLNVTTPVNKAARINIYTSGQNSWLVTPPIQIPATGYELKFDLALMAWNTVSTPVTAGNQADDKLKIVISDNPNMTNPTTLMEWNNTGSANVFDAIPATGGNYTIDLDAYVGTKYIAFYAESILDDAGDNDLMIDNVIVRQTPATPIFTINPTAWDFGQTIINTTQTKQFTVTNTGAGTLTLNSVIVTGTSFTMTVPPANMSLNAGISTTFTVQYAPTAVGSHEGTVTINDSRAVTTVDLDGVCFDPSIYFADLPYTQNFDSVTAPALPLGWSKVGATGSVYTYATTPRSAPNCMYMYTFSTPVPTLALPPVNMASETVLRLNFWARANYTVGDALIVGYLTNPTDASTFTPIQSVTLANLTYTQYSVNLGAVTGIKYFAIQTGTLYYSMLFDDLVIEEVLPIPTFAINPVLTETWSFGLVPIGGFAEKSFTISNNGGGNLAITGITTSDTYYSVIEVVPIDHDLGAGQATTFKARFTPTVVGGPFNGTVTVAYNDGTVQSLALNFAGSAYLPETLPLTEGWESGIGNWTVVNGTQTNQWFVGTADPHAGTKSVYISNDAGVSNVYDNAATSVVHVYKDIAFDADCLEFPLSFYWKGNGESSSYDYLQVFLVDTSFTPVAGTRLTTGQIGVNYNLQTVWNQANITIPGTLSGSVKRLVFSWWNDSSGGANPPINLDDISLTAVPLPSGPVLAPNLDSPADLAVGLPIAGFPFEFSWNSGGTEPETYTLYVYNSNSNEVQFMDDAYRFPEVTSPFTPTGIPFGYSEHWYWTVSGFNSDYPEPVYQWPPHEFSIEADPTVSIPPTYLTNFETWPPVNWNMAGGTGTIRQYADGNGNNWARYNYWSQTYDVTDIMTTPVLNATQPVVMDFTWSHVYNSTYPDDYLAVEGSTDQTNWTALWTKTTTDLDSGDGAGSTTPGTGVTETIVIPYINTNFWIRFNGISGYGPDLFIDDVTFRAPAPYDIVVTSITDLPSPQEIGTTYYPKATIKNNGSNAANCTVTMSFPGYSSPVTVSNLQFGQSTTVEFAAWTPAIAGTFSASVNAPYAGDDNLADNTMTTNFVVVSEMAGVWANGAPIPVGSYLGSAANYIDANGNGHVITVAGNSTPGTIVQDFNVNTNTWTTLTNLPVAAVVQASAVVGENLYVIAGSQASAYSNVVHKYNLTAGTWTTVSPLPAAIAWIKAAVYNNYIYVVGGNDGTNSQNTVFVYNTTTDTWLTATPMPVATFGGGCAITGNTLVYVAGATDDTITNLVYKGTISLADPAVITWDLSRGTYPGLPAFSKTGEGSSLAQTVASRPFKERRENSRSFFFPSGGMYRFDAATWGTDAIIVAGGSPTADWTPAVPSKAYIYQPATDLWTMLPDLNVAVLGSYLTSVQSDDFTWTAVVASGYTGTAVATTTQMFQVSSASTLVEPVVEVASGTGLVQLSWDHVIGAVAYDVYASNDPYAANWGTPYTTVYTPGYSFTGLDTFKFFKVVARSVAP